MGAFCAPPIPAHPPSFLHRQESSHNCHPLISVEITKKYAIIPHTMTKNKKSPPTQGMSDEERFQRLYDLLERGSQQRDEDIKRAAQERAEDRKRAEEARAEDRKRAEEDRKRADQEREEDRKRAEEAREEDRKRADQAREKDRKEFAERMAEIDRRLDKTAKQIGDYSRNEGELLELECKAALLEMGKLDGVTLDDVIHRRYNSSKNEGVEVDLIGINGKVVFPMEVKRTLSAADVRRFVEVRVGRFEQAFPQYAQGKEVRPVIIYAMPRSGEEEENPVEVALELGVIVLRSTGKNKLTLVTDASQVTDHQREED